jgi:hypothetical protein
VRERTAEKKTPKDCLMKMSPPFDLPPAVVNLAPEAGRRAGRKPGGWGLDIRAWRWGGVGPLLVVCGGYCYRRRDGLRCPGRGGWQRRRPRDWIESERGDRVSTGTKQE